MTMPELEIPELPWVAHAACRDTDPAVFFPEPGGNEREAIRICQTCVVRFACLAYALEAGERSGVWGGTTQRHRRRLLRLRSQRLSRTG